MEKTKEIRRNGLSIFLDEYNLAEYLKKAQSAQRQFGSNRVEGMSIRGNTYLKRMEQLIEVAHDIMDGKILPNLFDMIPIRKDGKFPKHRRIVIFENGIWHWITEPTALCILTQDTPEKYCDNTKHVTQTQARLAITRFTPGTKIRPLLNRRLDIQTQIPRVTYLKDNEIQPGGIYEEKYGDQYLYLGKISTEYIAENQQEFTVDYPRHHYLKVTRELKKIIQQSKSLDDVLRGLATERPVFLYIGFEFSTRIHPRKFVKECETPFIKQPWKNINTSKTDVRNLKPICKAYRPYQEELTPKHYVVFQERKTA